MVAPADPGRLVWDRQDRLQLGPIEERDQRPFVTLVRDRKDALDQGRVLRVMEGGVPEERVDRRQAGIARADAVAASDLHMLEKRSHQLSVDMVEAEFRRCLARPLMAERQQHPKRVAVGRDRMRAGGALFAEAVDEECLQGRRQVTHERSPVSGSRRSAAKARSSGAADKYQYVELGSKWPK